MKWIRIGFLSLVGCAVLLIAAMELPSLLHRQPGERSVYENRTLAQRPVLDRAAFWSGSYFEDWDEAIADQLPLRDDVIRANLWIKLHLKRSVVENGVVITKDALLPEMIFYDYSMDLTEPAAAAVERLLAVQSAVEDYGGVFLYVGVDEQRVALQELYPPYVFSNSGYYNRLARTFAEQAAQRGLNTLFLRDFYDGEDPLRWYSAVDHHYKMSGAYAVYQRICQRLCEQGVAVTPVSEQTLGFYELEEPFYGTYSRKLYDLSPIVERLTVFRTDGMPAFERWDDGAPAAAQVLSLPAKGVQPTYEVYMGGDHGETVIRTHRPELPSILIVGDSFTNPVECLAVWDFDEMRSLDYRHYDGKCLTEYLKEYPADVVIVLRDSLNYLGDEGNGDLK